MQRLTVPEKWHQVELDLRYDRVIFESKNSVVLVKIRSLFLRAYRRCVCLAEILAIEFLLRKSLIILVVNLLEVLNR